MARPETADYKHPVDPDDHLMTIQEYLNTIKSGAIIDDDGMGSPVKGGHFAYIGENVWIYPSEGIDAIPLDATHVAWFNK